MGDISQQQLDELLTSMSKSSASLGKIADGFGPNGNGKANALQKIADDLNTSRKAENDQVKKNTAGLGKHFDALSGATKSSSAFTNSLSSMAKDIIGLGSVWWVFDKIISYGEKNVETYQQLTKYGQNFSGSMIEMSRQAAAAGMPLQTFANVIKHNATVVGTMGTEAFFKFNKQVRQATEAQGMYGLTMEQMGELTGDYMQTQLLAGKNLKTLTTQQARKDFVDFLGNVTNVSEALSANRDVVLANTMNAMQDNSVLAQQRINTMSGMDGYNKAMQTAIAALAAQPGEAGKMLSKGLADAFGSPGGANFTDLGKAFIDAGQAQAAGLIDDANRRVQAGEDAQQVSMDTVTKLHSLLTNPETLRSLQLMRMAGGAQASAANEVLTLANSMKVYTQADVDAKKKENNRMSLFTTFFENFQSVFDGIKGSFIDGFLTPFMDASGQLDPKKIKEFWASVDALQPTFKEFGMAIGQLIKNFFQPETMRSIAGGFHTLFDVFNGMTKAATWVVNIFNRLYSVAEKINKTWAGVITAGALVAAWFGGKGLISLITNSIKGMLRFGVKDIQIKGNIVRVYGGGGGGGGGGGSPLDFLDGGEKAAGGKTRRELLEQASKKGLTGKAARDFVRAEEAAAEAGKVVSKTGRMGKILSAVTKFTGLAALGGVGGKIMEGAGKMLPKVGGAGIGKLLGRAGGMLIPGVGAAIDAKSAYDSAKDGNWLAAGLYGAGGVVNGLGAAADATGIGAVAGVPLDVLGGILSAGGLAADVTGFGRFGPKKAGAPKPKVPGQTPDGAAVPTPNAPPQQPTVVDDETVAQLRTDALLGNQKSIDELKKIQEGLAHQTMMLYSVARRNLEAQRDTSKKVAAGQGM